MADNGKPKKQYPFPRAVTRPITGPAYEEGMTFDQAKSAWYAYLRIVSNLRQMDLKPLHKNKD